MKNVTNTAVKSDTSYEQWKAQLRAAAIDQNELWDKFPVETIDHYLDDDWKQLYDLGLPLNDSAKEMLCVAAIIDFSRNVGKAGFISL